MKIGVYYLSACKPEDFYLKTLPNKNVTSQRNLLSACKPEDFFYLKTLPNKNVTSQRNLL
jgi:hypothetical protein